MTTTKTGNEFCVPGRFWMLIPERQRSAEELEALRELAALVVEEKAEEEAVLADWLESEG